MNAPTLVAAPPPQLSTAARRLVALALVGLHLALLVAWLQTPPARRALASIAPLVVSLMPADAVRPNPPPAELPRPKPEPPRLQPVPLPDLPPPEVVVREAPATPPPLAAPLPTPPAAAATDAPPLPSPPPMAQVTPPGPTITVATPPRPAEPLTVSIRAVAYLVPPVLDYPPAARRQGEEGLVQVRVLIGVDGVPRQLELLKSSGHRRLDDAALAAARATRFRPYMENGQARAAWVVMPLLFELQT